jgi:hypothetical protein
MARRIRFDAQDQAVLRALDSDFIISTDGERAVISGEMEIEIVRPADDGAICLTIEFSSGETLDLRIARAQLLEQLVA